MRERDSKEASGVLRARSWVEDEEGPAVEAEADGLGLGETRSAWCCSDRGGAVLTEEAEKPPSLPSPSGQSGRAAAENCVFFLFIANPRNHVFFIFPLSFFLFFFLQRLNFFHAAKIFFIMLI